VCRLFAAYLLDHCDEWDVLELKDVLQGSLLLGVFQTVFAAGFETRLTPGCVCPCQTLEKGMDFDTFLRGTGRRDNYLRRRKWFEKQPGYRLEVASSPAEVARPLADFFRLHALRWQGDGGSEGIRGARVEAFHRDTVHLLAERDAIRMYSLSMDGTAIASVYGMRHGSQFIYYQAGYHPDWHSKSPGMVLVGETFRDAIASGAMFYDFLRGEETYKSDWTSQQRRTVNLRIWPRGGPGAKMVRNEDFVKGAKSAVRNAIPTAAMEKLKRLRR
jgi:CelD/BcsL family acetyltransferase involved in cellulose biosynthesis